MAAAARKIVRNWILGLLLAGIAPVVNPRLDRLHAALSAYRQNATTWAGASQWTTAMSRPVSRSPNFNGCPQKRNPPACCPVLQHAVDKKRVAFQRARRLAGLQGTHP